MKQNLLFNQASALGKRLAMVLTMLLIVGVGQAWGAEGDVLKTYDTNSSTFASGYSRKTGDNFVWWGQKGYYGANSATNHGNLKPTASDLPVVKAQNSSATTNTTGYYYLYTSEAIANVGKVEIKFTAKSGSSTVNAYIVSSSTEAASGSATWTKVTLASNSSKAQGANVATAATYTFTFDATETDAKYYGVVFVTSSYWRATNLTFKLYEGAPVVTEPYTVKFYKTSTTFESVTEKSAGAGVTPPTMEEECGDWTFQGWSESPSNSETSTTKLDLVTLDDGIYYPTADAELYPVYTKSEGGGGTAYTKVTTISEGVYVMVSEKTSGTYKYMPNTTSSSANPNLGSGITISTTSGITSLTNEVTDAMLWDFTSTGTANQFYLRPHGSTTIGLGCTTSTGANIRISSTYKDVKWTITTSSSYGWQFKSNASSAMYLAVYSDSNWRNYTSSTTNQNGKFHLFKQTSSSTTYYFSYPQCATQTVPSLSASESSLAFGNVTVNSSEELEFTLSGSNLTADAILALSGTNEGLFSVSPTSVTPTDGSITKIITVTYTPNAKAFHSATLTISSEGAESIEIQLSGTGVAQTANYTVKHYKQNLDGTYPTEPTETEYSSGEVGTNVTPAVKSYEGFTAPTEEKSIEITADGNAVVEYQYARNSYTLTWELDGGTIKTAGTAAGLVKYGASLTAPVVVKDGFNFKGWKDQNGSTEVASTMPANALTYTAQWKETYTVTFLNHGEEVEQVTIEAGDPVTLPTEELTSCDAENYPDFFGWTETPIAGVGTEKPTDLITADFTPERSMTLHAVFVDQLPQAGGWQVVTSVSELVAGKIYTIGSFGSPTTGTAMGTQNTNNRGTTSWTTGTPVELTLGGSTGEWTLYDPIEGGYLYAASSSENYLKTQTTLNNNGRWAITISNNKAKIQAQGDKTRNIIRYNSSSKIFSCYASGQGDIQLLTKSMATEPSAFITSCCETEAPTDGFIDGVKGSGNAMSVTLYWKDANDYQRYHVVCDELEIDEHVENTNFQTKEVLSECTTYIFKVSSAPDPGCESPVLEIEATPFIPKTIAFEDGDNTTKQSTTCDSQSITVPTPTPQNCSTYVWIDAETGTEYTAGQTFTPDKDMTIVAKWSVEMYTITFNDWDGTQLQQTEVKCGQTPAYNGETPTRPESNTHKYTFAGWTPSIKEVDGKQTYTATYTETQHQITVIWMVNGEEYTLGDPSTTVSAGEKVAKLPTPPSPDDYCGQVFAGWTDQPIDGAPIADAPAVLFNTPEASPTLYKEGDKTTVTFYAVFADIKE